MKLTISVLVRTHLGIQSVSSSRSDLALLITSGGVPAHHCLKNICGKVRRFFLASAELADIVSKRVKHRKCYLDPQPQRTEELSGFNMKL